MTLWRFTRYQFSTLFSLSFVLILTACADKPNVDQDIPLEHTPFRYSVTEGPLPEGAGATDALGTNAKFNKPQGLAIDLKGNLYLADMGNQTIRKISSKGSVTTLAGSPAVPGSIDGKGGEARFYGAQSIAVDTSGYLYVVDRNNNGIRKINTDGEVSTVAGSIDDLKIVTEGKTITQTGTIPIAGITNGRGVAARFSFPQGIAIDHRGNLFVTDGNTVRKITKAGDVTTFAGKLPIRFEDFGGYADGVGEAARFNHPTGITVDEKDNLYVVDASKIIRRITPDGTVSTLAGSADSGGNIDGKGKAARFSGLRGITVDAVGNLYVCDAINHNIRKISNEGMVSTLVGSIKLSGQLDDVTPADRLLDPVGIVVDPFGNLYVSDAIYQSIRKITPTGEISTFVGNTVTPKWPQESRYYF